MQQPCKWERNETDINARVHSIQPVVSLLQSRERRDFSRKGQHFQFIENIYYSWFPETTPRAIIIERRGNDYKKLEFKFHPNCKNGC